MKISNSRLDTYRRCPRKYWWTYVENIVTRRDSVPLIVGDAVHRGLAAHHAGKDEPEIVVAAKEAFDEVRTKGKWMEGELSDLAAQEEYARLVLRWYREEYPTEVWEMLAPEVQGHVPLGDHEFYFRADGLVSWKGFVWVLENKTTSAFGDIYFKRFRNDGQITSYMWSVWKHGFDRPRGTIINAIRKSKKLDRADFQRDFVLRTEGQLEEYMQQVQHECDEIDKLLYNETDNHYMWLMHTHECVAFNRTCEYLELCIKDRLEMRAAFMDREPDYVDLGGDKE